MASLRRWSIPAFHSSRLRSCSAAFIHVSQGLCSGWLESGFERGSGTRGVLGFVSGDLVSVNVVVVVGLFLCWVELISREQFSGACFSKRRSFDYALPDGRASLRMTAKSKS